MNFLALSQAPPPEVIEIATNRPVTITPSSMAPTEENAADLPAHLLHDRCRRAADGGHAHGAEEIGQEPAEQQAHHDVRIVQREIELEALEVRILRGIGDEEFQVFVVGRE